VPTVRAVVFDIGGVLEVGANGREPTSASATMVAAWESRLSLLQGELSDALDVLYERGLLGTITEEEWHERLCAQIGVERRHLDVFVEESWDLYLGQLNQELATYFRSLRPVHSTALLSNSFVGARGREKARYDFDAMTDLIVYSHEEGVAKPDPRIYVTTAERLGVLPTETLFLDDVEEYVEGARATGMHGVLFRDNAQAMREIDVLLRSARS